MGVGRWEYHQVMRARERAVTWPVIANQLFEPMPIQHARGTDSLCPRCYVGNLPQDDAQRPKQDERVRSVQGRQREFGSSPAREQFELVHPFGVPAQCAVAIHTVL